MRGNWFGWSRASQEPPRRTRLMNWKPPEHWLQSSEFYVTADWETSVQERSPFSQIKTFKAWLKSADDQVEKDQAFQRTVLWSDKTEIELFGHDDLTYKGKLYEMLDMVAGGSHPLGLFCASGIWCMMLKSLRTLRQNLKLSAIWLKLGHSWEFQQRQWPRTHTLMQVTVICVMIPQSRCKRCHFMLNLFHQDGWFVHSQDWVHSFQQSSTQTSNNNSN